MDTETLCNGRACHATCLCILQNSRSGIAVCIIGNNMMDDDSYGLVGYTGGIRLEFFGDGRLIPNGVVMELCILFR